MTTSTARRVVRGGCPLDCPDTCSWLVTTEGGRAVKLIGDPDHPFTRGALCAKVNSYLDHTRAPGRLLHPLRRTGDKGSGRFERIGWDDALDLVAERLQSVIDEDGPEAIWPYHGTGTMGYIQGVGGSGRRLWNALGASQHDPTICSVSGLLGSEYTLGSQGTIDPETLSESRLILLWGTNLLTTGHHGWRFILEARRRGARVVAIDPVLTRTAKQADQHLAPIPGTDAALALGLANVIVSRGAEDRDFLARRTLGWESFRERILEFPPTRAAEITGVPEEQIVWLGELMAASRPTAIRTGQGLQRHGGGGSTFRVLTALAGITGDWSHPGGGVAYSTWAHFPGNEDALLRDDLRPAGTRTLRMTRLGHGLLEVDDPPVNALFVWNANPLASNPHQNRVRTGLARNDLFTVVVDHFQTDTADHADIVLPATMQVEHLDIHNAYGHLYLVWNEPAVDPPGECLPNTEIFRRLASRLAPELTELQASDLELARDLLDSDHPALAGITLERLRRDGSIRLNYPQPFVPFADGFPTPSGKLEFYSARAAQQGLDPLPGYTPPHEVSQTDSALARRYPLALIAAASHYFMNSIFSQRDELRRRQGEPRITLHPADAATRDLAGSERVRIFNDRGSFEAIVEIADSVRPGVAVLTKGHWPKHLAGGSGVNATVNERDSDIGAGAVYHDNRVEVQPLAAVV